MGLFKKQPLIRPALVAIFLLTSSFSWAVSSSDDLRHLKEKMTAFQNQVAGEELKKKNLSLKESQLTQKIEALKKGSGSRPGLLANLRIENLLKELRENLIQQQESDNRRFFFQQQISRTRDELDAQMENEIGRLIESAKESFKGGNEKDADRSYQEALQLMEEHKKLQTAMLDNSTGLPSMAEFVLDGKESADKLREIADFATHDRDNLDKELKILQEDKDRIKEEIALRKNLIKYPGLLERGDNAPPFQVEIVEKELIQFEKKSKIIENKIIKAKEVSKILSRKVREIERIIQQKEP